MAEDSAIHVIFYDFLELVGFRKNLFEVLSRVVKGTVQHLTDERRVAEIMASKPNTVCVVMFSMWLDRLIAHGVPLDRVHFIMHIGGGLTWSDFCVMRQHGLYERFTKCAAVYSYIQRVEGTIEISCAIGEVFCDVAVPRAFTGKSRDDCVGTRLCVVADIRYDPFKKNLFTIVRAWPHLRGLGYTLTIGGGNWRAWLLARGVAPDVLEGIHFKGAWMSQKEMKALFCDSDIFVVDSTADDGFPTTCGVEAMACGCALVASDSQNQTRFDPTIHFVPFRHRDSEDMVRAILHATCGVAMAGWEFVQRTCPGHVVYRPLTDRLALLAPLAHLADPITGELKDEYMVEQAHLNEKCAPALFEQLNKALANIAPAPAPAMTTTVVRPTLPVLVGRGDRVPAGFVGHTMTTPLPFDADTVPAVFLEHTLDKVDEVEGASILRDCFRALAPGGVLRVCVPTLDGTLRLLTCGDDDDPALKRAQVTFSRSFVPMDRVALVNCILLGESVHGLRYLSGTKSVSCGRKHFYTTESLVAALQAAGFEDVAVAPYGKSRCQALAGQDARAPIVDVCVEGTKLPLGPSKALAVYIATYNRPDGTTPAKLGTCLASIAAQTTSTPVHVFIVGDCFEPTEVLEEVVAAAGLPCSCTVSNLPVPGERGRITDKRLLWMVAGATACNAGRAAALTAGYTWAAHLDDDDVWAPDHLEHIEAGIRRHPDAVLVHTQSQFCAIPRFPAVDTSAISRGFASLVCNVIHSSVAMHLGRTRDIPYVTEGDTPADAVMWRSVQAAFGLPSLVHVPACTVWHLSQGGSKDTTRLLRLVYKDAELTAPAADVIPDASVAYVRFDGFSKNPDEDIIALWQTKLLPGGVLLYRGEADGAPQDAMYECRRPGYVVYRKPV